MMSAQQNDEFIEIILEAMKMALILKNIRIDNCGVVISAPKDPHIHAHGFETNHTKRAIELRDSPAPF